MGKSRKFMTETVHDEVELRFPASSLSVKGSANDLSYGGIGIYCGQRLPVGEETLIIMGFLSPNGEIRFETIEGSVRWCRTKGPGFTAGVEFGELDPERHILLLTFLDKTECFRKAVGQSHQPDEL